MRQTGVAPALGRGWLFQMINRKISSISGFHNFQKSGVVLVCVPHVCEVCAHVCVCARTCVGVSVYTYVVCVCVCGVCVCGVVCVFML